MPWETTPYTVPLVVAGLASFGFAGYVVSRRSHGTWPLVGSFLAVAVGAGTWSLAYAAQLSVTTPEAALFWNRFVWLGVGLLAFAWPAFVAAYVDRPDWLRPPRVVAIAIVPAAVVVAALTVGPVPLLYETTSFDTTGGGYSVLSVSPAPALVGFMTYSYVVNGVTFVVLGRTVVRRSGVFRRQAGLLLLAGVLPTAASVVTVRGPFGPSLIDVTPVSFAFTSGLLAWVLFRYRLLDLSPVAREAVFTNRSDGVVVIDGERRVVDVNDRARELLSGVRVGDPVESVFEDAPDVIETIRSGATADGNAPVEYAVDRRFLSVSTHGLSASTFDGSGDVDAGVERGTVVLIRDVTERQTLQRRYRALIEKSPNVVAVAGADGRVRYVSPSVERLLGYDPESLEGERVLDVVHPDDHAESRRRFEAALEAGVPRPFEHRVEHTNGDWRTFETVIERPFEEATDEVMITATDVTDRRRHEQRLQVLNRVLRHDLKNDANVIGGYTDLLRDHVDEEGHPHLDVIDRKVETLTHLSDQAREIDVALHDDDQRARIDLAALVPRLCDALETTFPRASVTVSVPESAVVTADELLESAIRNVLENAVVHNEGAAAEITVTVADTGAGSYRVDVADDGPGIPPIERAVFSEGRETALEHASGLGLWLVHWIVTGSGGELAITSRDPTGTTVSMWFHAAADPGSSDPRPDTAASSITESESEDATDAES